MMKMTEQKRFTITICDNYRHILKDKNSTLSITLGGMSSEAEVKLCDTLNKLHKENEELKKRLKEKGDNLKEYYYDENGEKIESFDNEKLLTSLLQDIINELQNGWFVAEYESDFNNEVDINTLEVFEKNISMDIKLRKHGKWLMIGQNKG